MIRFSRTQQTWQSGSKLTELKLTRMPQKYSHRLAKLTRPALFITEMTLSFSTLSFAAIFPNCSSWSRAKIMYSGESGGVESKGPMFVVAERERIFSPSATNQYVVVTLHNRKALSSLAFLGNRFPLAVVVLFDSDLMRRSVRSTFSSRFAQCFSSIAQTCWGHPVRPRFLGDSSFD